MSEWVLLAAGLLARGQVDEQPSSVPPMNGVVRQTDPAPMPQTPIRAHVERPVSDLPEFSGRDRVSTSQMRIAGMPASLVSSSEARSGREPRGLFSFAPNRGLAAAPASEFPLEST